MDTQNSQFNLSVKAGLIVGLSLILGLAFDYFFYAKVPGLAFPLYVILILIGLFFAAAVINRPIDKQTFWLLPPLLFFSGMVFVRASALLTFLNVVGSLLLLLFINQVSMGTKLKNFLLGDYIRIAFLPIRFVQPLFQTLRDLFLLRGIRKDQQALWQVVKGIAIAIPLLLIFILLFSSADLIFQKYLSDLITIEIEFETVFRAILIFLVTLGFIGAYAYAFRKTEAAAAAQELRSYAFGRIESYIVFASVNALFFIFILVQLTYLFGGDGNISAQGFTYAEYARRGFFELIAVAIISLALLLTAEKYIVRKETKHSSGFKILITILIAEVILIMFSAFMRLSLYEEAYGFTTLRLYSHAFIILLAAVFGLVLYKIYRNEKANFFAFQVFVSVMLFLAAMNIFNPDAFIARRNLERFEKTGKLDVFYLSSLSEDALPETIGILNISDEDLRQSFARDMYWHAQGISSPPFSGWQSLNLSRLRASKLLGARMGELEQYKDYRSQESYRETPYRGI